MTQLLDRLTAALDERMRARGHDWPPNPRDLAVLALETMREPTTDMVDAANPETDIDNAAVIWRAMVDIALGVE